MKFILFLVFFSFSACASLPEKTIEERITENMEPQIGTLRKGAVVGILEKGKMKFLSFGGLKENSIFEIASLTKTFTSLMLSIAIEKELVTPDTTLAEIRPEWEKSKLGKITLLELSTHRSGLPRLPCDFHYKDPKSPYADYTEDELVKSISDETIERSKDCEILARPTKESHYSNWGPALLGNALSVRSGLSYGDMLRKWITGPLGMRDTVISLSTEQRPRVIQGFDEDLSPTPLWERAGMYGNGAILSTPEDIMIYARAMVRPEETPFPKAIRRAQERQFKHMAYGWFVTRGDNIWHNGMTGGFSSLFKAYLDKDMAVFALSNTASEITCLIEAVEEIPCNPKSDQKK